MPKFQVCLFTVFSTLTHLHSLPDTHSEVISIRGHTGGAKACTTMHMFKEYLLSLELGGSWCVNAEEEGR